MTDSRRQRFLPYVIYLADLMALKDWVFVIDDTAPDSDAAARTYFPDGRKFARIHLSDALLDDPPERQRWTIVHELVHCHYAAMWFLVDELLRGAAKLAARNAFEYGVDGTARAWAELLPLPGEEGEMPKGSKVEKVYKAILKKPGTTKESAAKISQAVTGQSLKTGRKPKSKGKGK